MRKYNFQGYFAFKKSQTRSRIINEPCPLEERNILFNIMTKCNQKKIPCQDIFSWQNERRTRDDGWIQQESKDNFS